jgi:GNAT superfamily N-acetyltransferase
MKGRHQELEFAIEVFVRGHCAGKSRTFPYQASRVGSLWVKRDAPRSNPHDYRKEGPILTDLLCDDAPFRQYVALDGEEIVGRVRSVDSAGARWCTDMHVHASHRRRGIGRALLCRMLRDNRARGSAAKIDRKRRRLTACCLVAEELPQNSRASLASIASSAA